jgi:hypothetical protein
LKRVDPELQLWQTLVELHRVQFVTEHPKQLFAKSVDPIWQV